MRSFAIEESNSPIPALCATLWCTYLWSSILDSDACVYDAYIYDPWSWYMHVSMFLDPWFMHVWCTKGSCIHDAIFFGNGPTDKAILGVGCMYLWSWILSHVCMMHLLYVQFLTLMYVCFLTLIYVAMVRNVYVWCICMMHDPWSWYMHVWCISYPDTRDYDAHICMMHLSMMHDAWIYDGLSIYDAKLFGDEPMNERTNKAILGVGL